MRVFAIEVMDPRVVWQVGMAASEAGAAHVIATDLPGFSACDALCAGCDLKRACGSSLRSSLRASLSLARARSPHALDVRRGRCLLVLSRVVSKRCKHAPCTAHRQHAAPHACAARSQHTYGM